MGTHDHPLLIKNLLLVPLRQPNGHGILYRDVTRYDYKIFGERVGRLGSALAVLGVRKGDTVAVMDWDTPRYLESFFAIPMIGAVLQTVNVRLPPEQVQYTLEHAEASVILCNTEFLGLLKAIWPKLGGVRSFIRLARLVCRRGFPFPTGRSCCRRSPSSTRYRCARPTSICR